MKEYLDRLSRELGFKNQLRIIRDFFIYCLAILVSSILNQIRYRKTKMKFLHSPIIIGGCGRSGTTLLHAVISAHPDVLAIPEETQAFSRMAHERAYIKGFSTFNTGYIYKRLHQLGVDPGHKRWCEKTPRNIYFFARLLKYYKGNVRLIQIVRDGRDVVLSNHPRAEKHGNWVSADRWIKDVSAGVSFLNDDRVLLVRYEDLVLNSEREIKRICEYLSLDYCIEMENWVTNAQIQENSAWNGKLKPMDSSSIGKWEKERDFPEVKKIEQDPIGHFLLERYHYVDLKNEKE